MESGHWHLDATKECINYIRTANIIIPCNNHVERFSLDVLIITIFLLFCISMDLHYVFGK